MPYIYYFFHFLITCVFLSDMTYVYRINRISDKQKKHTNVSVMTSRDVLRVGPLQWFPPIFPCWLYIWQNGKGDRLARVVLGTVELSFFYTAP